MARGEPPPLTDNINFHPLSGEELTAGRMIGMSLSQLGLRPMHKTYTCGGCGATTNGRVLCRARRKSDSAAEVFWCWCSCEKQEPTVLIEKNGTLEVQYPIARDFLSHHSWPPALRQLFDEAAMALSAGAFTACAMVARKVLMAAACDQGAVEGESFASYVKYITDEILKYPKAKTTIDGIREIGNEANHSVQFVSREDATRAMSIVKYMLNTIYVTA